MADNSGRLVVMALDMLGSDEGMGTILSTVSAKRLGVGLDEFLSGDAKTVRREMDITRSQVFGEPDADPTQDQASG
tara:strand:+ start:1777 stop:2004 length:228 start_codon:yes stop_codon:yes gene_type:complete